RCHGPSRHDSSPIVTRRHARYRRVARAFSASSARHRRCTRRARALAGGGTTMRTWLGQGTELLHTLWAAMDYGRLDRERAADVFRSLAVPWGSARADGPPPWCTSDVSDDHTPFEFSLAIDGASPELRFLVEVQGDEPSILSNWRAARAANKSLEQ